jgi:hypothetical protein
MQTSQLLLATSLPAPRQRSDVKCRETTMLKAIGFWAEEALQDRKTVPPLRMRLLHRLGILPDREIDYETVVVHDYAHPQKLPLLEDNTLVSLLTDYLRNGRRFRGYLGWSFCRYRCGIPDSEMGDCDLTDGVWVWPQGLAHYTEVHRVSLPDEFIEHVRLGEASLPDTKDPDDSEGFDFACWEQWCKTCST